MALTLRTDGLCSEIRNYVYELLLPSSKTIVLRPTPDHVPDWHVQVRHSLGLTQTCRQIRAEIYPMFLSRYTFHTIYNIGQGDEPSLQIVWNPDSHESHIEVALNIDKLSLGIANFLTLLQVFTNSPGLRLNICDSSAEPGTEGSWKALLGCYHENRSTGSLHDEGHSNAPHEAGNTESNRREKRKNVRQHPRLDQLAHHKSASNNPYASLSLTSGITNQQTTNDDVWLRFQTNRLERSVDQLWRQRCV